MTLQSARLAGRCAAEHPTADPSQRTGPVRATERYAIVRFRSEFESDIGRRGARDTNSLTADQWPETTVLVAIQSAQVREALAAMLGALERFTLVAEADNAESAVDAARRLCPDLALIEPELSDCGGWWAIKQIQAEHLAGVVVALGRRPDCGGLAQLVGAQTYVQMGTSPRDLLQALEAAMTTQRALLQPDPAAQGV
jgi:CheY-like chemotaxis protein